MRDLMERLVQSNQEQMTREIKMNQDLTKVTNLVEQLGQVSHDLRKEMFDLKNELLGQQDDHRQKEIEKLDNQVSSFKKDREDIYHSYSWKIGRTITKLIDFLFGWIVK
ncbi:MAG: hypothetical protein IPL46_27935 [Saprospiraceae bacterium]|nr:hypothetical protein [Saprospiraceae bacterium]